MSDNTKIEWTDATANVINGCTVVSPGCEHCYAMRLAATRMKHHPSREGLARMHKGKPQWTGEVSFHEPALEQVLRWQRPRRIFWNAHGDTFHEKAKPDRIDQCFAVMALTPHHTHQVLTKRPERARTYLTHSMRQGLIWATAKQEFGRHPASEVWPLPNVWLGTSVEDQRRAEERVPTLLETPAAVRWLSMEPLLGPVDISEWLGFWEPSEQVWTAPGSSYTTETPHPPRPQIDWVVVGGESGPDSRPMHPAWAQALRDQCAAAGVPFHFKQWGDWAPFGAAEFIAAADAGRVPTSERRELVYERPAERAGLMQDVWRVGKKAAGRKLDGVQHDGYPG